MVCSKTIRGSKVPGTWDRGLLDERARYGGELQVLSAAKSSLCGCVEGIGGEKGMSKIKAADDRCPEVVIGTVHRREVEMRIAWQ